MEIKERRSIPIYVFGKKYEVPESLTIQKAMEFSGYRFIRSCGCRGGICGACLTEYRTPGDYRLKVVLACQALVETGMQITQSPFIPLNRSQYHLEELKIPPGILGDIYSEIYRCLQCNTCTRVCPMEIQVMDYVAAAMRGDLEKVANLSFQCVMCGACAAKCPAEISQPTMALLARRLYGRYVLSLPESLTQRIKDIEGGRYHPALEQLIRLSTEELKNIYTLREQEPQDSQEWVPKNPNFPEGIGDRVVEETSEQGRTKD
ncbi:MAG: 4Fe-4S dicluster domain-containing protein [Thermodesulfobacteriota bacterium]|nr:4Fe-4S dicluster domain-containing protein [Thermodesulfobacteriota bacterium]